jgi:hypothetical protein
VRDTRLLDNQQCVFDGLESSMDPSKPGAAKAGSVVEMFQYQ